MYISKMIIKTFEKFSYTSVGISSFLLLATAYYYTTLDIKWSIFESSLLNGVIIFGALMLSSYAIDTITRELTIERSNRNGYHLLLYPLVVLSYPIESVDLRFILSSALLWAAWRNMRIFLELTNNRKKIKRLFDASLLLSFSSLIIFENIFIFSTYYSYTYSKYEKRLKIFYSSNFSTNYDIACSIRNHFFFIT